MGLWIGVRAAILLPDWSSGTGAIPAAVAAPAPPAAIVEGPIQFAAAAPIQPAVPAVGRKYWPTIPDFALLPPARKSPQGEVAPGPRTAILSIGPQGGSPSTPAPVPAGAPQVPSGPLLLPIRPASVTSPWSLSGWLLVRREQGAATLAPGGTLGGSQAGARLSYALGSRVSLSARAYLPLRRPAGAEAAAGVDWRPLPALPLNLLADYRQPLGREGRAAFSLTAYGGASRVLTPRLRVDLYGQAGVLGLKARDLFVDGSLRLARRIGPVELGAGAWGAAQPGAARLDAGPSLSWHLPIRRANLRLQADWRFRLAGEAAPRSGPALTLASDF
jgi:hypothetical protein